MEEEERKKILTEIQNEIRDIVNWIAVFNQEYNLPEEVVDQLKQKLDSVSQKVDQINHG